MSADVDYYNYYRFSAFTFILTAVLLGVPLIVCVILLIMIYLRRRKVKQQTGQFVIESLLSPHIEFHTGLLLSTKVL